MGQLYSTQKASLSDKVALVISKTLYNADGVRSSRSNYAWDSRSMTSNSFK